MAGAAELIATHLAGLGRGTLGTDLFWNFSPDSPAKMGVVFDTSGLDPVRVFNDFPFEMPRVQILRRDKLAKSAEDWLRAVVSDLQGATITVNTVEFSDIEPLQQPFLLDANDEQGNVTYAVNLQLTRRL